MKRHYKEILLLAGVNATDDNIENIENIIDHANTFGRKMDIYDVAKILSLPSFDSCVLQINVTKAADILSKIIKENNNESERIN